MKRARLRRYDRLRYRPQFTGSIEGFLVNTINKNFWRVDRVMTKQDLYQDGVMLFCMLRLRYDRIVDNPKWFMALYKRSLLNHINDISNVQSKLASADALPDDVEDVEPSINDAEMACMFDNAPPEVWEIVRLFLNAPIELWQVLSKAWNARGNRRKKGKRLIADALGKPEDFDARKVVHDYLDGKEEG